MDEIYVKAFVSFIIGALVYNLIDSMKLCNKNIVEGQSTDSSPSAEPGTCTKVAGRTGPRAASVTEATCNARTSEVECQPLTEPVGSNVCLWTPSASQFDALNSISSPNQLDEIIADINNKLFLSETDSDGPTFITVLKQIAGATGTDTNDAVFTRPAGIFNNVNSLSDLGNPFNSEALDLIELIIRNFIKADTDTLRTGPMSILINPGNDLCNNDINIYIYALPLLLYNKTIDTSVEMGYIINISNRLSKYIPDILDKIQELYQNCGDDTAYDPKKSQILKGMYQNLFKNNKTVVNFNGIGDLMKSLENVKTIYIILFMICFTYIIVKFMGMFNMKVNM